MRKQVKDLLFGNSTDDVAKKLEAAHTHNSANIVDKATEIINAVEHPVHYGGQQNAYEAIKVIEAWQLGFNLGNTVKYICRAGKKDKAKLLQDLKKAQWYLEREINNLENS